VVVGVLVAAIFAVSVIGILAAIAIPNLLTAMQHSKQKRTMADMRMIAVASEAYATDHREYPKDGALESFLVPTYIRAVPRIDGWNHPFRYECWSTAGDEKCDAYAIGSGGKDGAFERSSLKEYPGEQATMNFNDDIVFSGGSFKQYPQGARQ
jgi:type II secretory pathway pseudopilin PulG